MTNKATNKHIISRLLELYESHSKKQFIMLVSQKIQRRILYFFLLGPNETKKYVRKCFITNINKALDSQLNEENIKGKRILEIGCGRGQDFLKYFEDIEGVQLFGLDLKRRKELDDINNFSFIQADASDIPYPDNYFDIGVSIGVLEHIVPNEKLSSVLLECSRVCKSYVHIVPSISTLWEPHTGVYRWQLRSCNNKVTYEAPLNFFSDEAWLDFEGLQGAFTFRFNTVPVICTALAIYKNI